MLSVQQTCLTPTANKKASLKSSTVPNFSAGRKRYVRASKQQKGANIHTNGFLP